MTDEQALEIIRKLMPQSLRSIKDKLRFEALLTVEGLLKEQIRTAKSDSEKFNGRCPYTNKECDDFHCWRCEVNEEEREWLNSEIENV